MNSDDMIIKKAIKKYGPITNRFILRLGKEDGKFEPWCLGPETVEEDFAGYLACLHLYKTHKAVEKRMSDQKKLKTFKKREAKAETKKQIHFKLKTETKE